MFCADLQQLTASLPTGGCRPWLPQVTRIVCGHCGRLETCPSLGVDQVLYLAKAKPDAAPPTTASNH